jgi:hypothetical protein
MFGTSKIVRLACLACVAAAGLSIGLFQPAQAGAAEVIIRRGPVVLPAPVVKVAPLVPVAPVAPVVRVEPIVRVGPVYTHPWYRR